MPSPAIPLRLALIGCGRWGENILRTIPRIDGARLCRVASRNPHSSALVPEDCAISPDWRDVIAADDIDAVLIATPPPTHAEITLSAIHHGKPFFVEKPMTMDSASANNICLEAETAGVFGMVDHIHLFSPAFRKLCSLSTALGPIEEINATAGKNAAEPGDTPVLWDWGPHDIAMCLQLLGRGPIGLGARDVDASASNKQPGVELMLDFGDARAHLFFSNALSARRRTFNVVHRDGVLTYDDSAGPRLTRRQKAETAVEENIPFDNTLPLDIALHEFCAAIVDGSTDNNSLRLGADTVQIIEDAARSMPPLPQPAHHNRSYP